MIEKYFELEFTRNINEILEISFESDVRLLCGDKFFSKSKARTVLLEMVLIKKCV